MNLIPRKSDRRADPDTVTLFAPRDMLPPMPMPGADSSRGRTTGAELRVLLVADYDIFDRFGRMLRQLALGLHGKGVSVSLLTDDPVAAADWTAPLECHWQRFLSGWLAPWRVYRFLDRLEQKPDVIHVWGTACLDAVGRWAVRANVPVLVHVLGPADVQQVLHPRWRGRVRVLAGNDALRRTLAGATVLKTLEMADFSPVFSPSGPPPKPAGEGQLLGVMWVGRLIADAGVEVLVNAIATLHAANCDLQAALIGAGPQAAAIRRHIRQAGVVDRVSLIEEPDLWEPAVAGVDVCVVPARQDEVFLAPLVSMALGKVVIASRDQSADWFVEDQTCWHFTPGSAPELAHHLEKVAASRAAADKLRDSARAYASAHYPLDRLVDELQRAYVACASAVTANSR